MNKNRDTHIISHDKDVVLSVENISKKFCKILKRSMYYGMLDVIRNFFGFRYNTGELRKDEFWALKDVTFDLRKGERLGIVGVNGGGKSTLLRLISGIFPPDRGRICHRGRVGALIAVGAGFHPHMTGRENIYLKGTILGMTRNEIDSKIDEIVEFSEIGEFLDAPVNTFSSGMRMRLGFSIAMFCEPDILLVDEVLSVGDISFRNKSLRKMAELRDRANALIFISHNLEQVSVLCDRVIILHKGRIVFDGDTHEGLVMYENFSKDTRVLINNRSMEISQMFRERRTESGMIGFIDLGILDSSGIKTCEININEGMTVYLDFILHENADELLFTVSILNEKKNIDCLWVNSNHNKEYEFKDVKKGEYRVVVSFREHHLGPGVYYINYAIRNGITGETYDHGFTNLSFSVKSDRHLETGIVLSEPEWSLEKKDSM